MAERVRISLLSAMRIAVTGLLLTEYLISREIQFGKRAQCASQCCTRGPRARPTLVMAARDSLFYCQNSAVLMIRILLFAFVVNLIDSSFLYLQSLSESGNWASKAKASISRRI
jgi:hypothetical protein